MRRKDSVRGSFLDAYFEMPVTTGVFVVMWLWAKNRTVARVKRANELAVAS
jgi:hypothetical protein